jgi:hypothetical protein
LEDEERSGRRVINDESVERGILDHLAKAPPQGFARWNGRLVAEVLGDVSDDAVWRVMRKHDLHLDRRPELVREYRSGVFPARRAKLLVSILIRRKMPSC